MRKHIGKSCKIPLERRLKENDNFIADKQYNYVVIFGLGCSTIFWHCYVFEDVKLLLIALNYYRQEKKKSHLNLHLESFFLRIELLLCNLYL